MPTLSPEEFQCIILSDRSIWSDETEMLAKLRADFHSWVTKKVVNWKKMLPERFVECATAPNIPTADQMQQINRGLYKQLDAIAARYGAKK